MDYPDPASLQAAMEVPVTATLGCTGPLLQKLQSLMASKHSWPEGVNEVEIQRLKRDLEVLCISLKDVSEAEDSSFMAKCWMNEVRELCFDTEDHLDEFMNSGAGAHESANGFSGLVARAVDATERRTLFNLAAKAIKTLLPGEAGVRRLTPTSVHACAGGRGLVGVDVHMNNIVNLLDSDQKNLKVVPLFGCSGLGKTTVARSVYDQLQQFECRAFVRVSRDPDMRKLLTSILSQIKAPWTGGYPDAQDLIVRIKKHLQGKRYFIVIDDVWTASVWDIISRAFPDGDDCSRIVTTTEIYDVALVCCRYCSDDIYEMRLNDDQPRKLFSGRVFGSEHGCPPEFETVSAEIIRKCGGLPLAITNITNLLASGLPLDKWKLILDSLSSTLSTNPSEMMKEVLNLVYNDLPPHLKTCLLYLSMYPEGYTIEKHDLARQFVAEGFVRVIEGRDLEETAKGYFDELVSKGVIQPVDTNCDGEVLSCTVHHIVLDFIRYRAKVENFIITVDHLQSSLALPDKVRRLSIQFGGSKSADIPESIVVSQVRSLTFCGFVECVPPVAAYGLLRVLVLHIWADQGKGNFDLSRIAELFRLKYLQIQCNITVKLPYKIQGLQSLETLEVDARLSAVPSDIGHLEKLQHLRLPAEANVRGPGNKKCLEWILFENLSNLKSVVLALASSSEKNALNAASASSMSISDGFSMVSSPPPLLQRLELSWRCCIFSNLPQWTKELTKLCILKIAVGELLAHDIDLLGELSSLSALSLYVQTTPAEWIVFGKAGFSVLKYFKFRCSVPLLKFEVDTMPNLQKLKLVFNGPAVDKHCTARMGIEHLSSLEEISAKIGGAVADAESTLRTAVSKHPCNPRIVVQLMDHILYSSPSMGTKNKEHTAQDENKVEDEKKQADIRNSAFPESSSRLPIPGPENVESKPSIMEDAMVSASMGAMNSLLAKLTALMGGGFTELIGTRKEAKILFEKLGAMSGYLEQLAGMSVLTEEMKGLKNEMRSKTYDIEDCVDDLMIQFKKDSSVPEACAYAEKWDALQTYIDQTHDLIVRMEKVDLRHYKDIKAEAHTLGQSYSDLPYYMKSCFLYFSVFRNDVVIRKDRLIWRWIAEGLIPRRAEESSWETGVSYFMELIARKLIDPVYGEANYWGLVEVDQVPVGCKVQGLILDFIKSLSNEESFVTTAEEATYTQHDMIRRFTVRYSIEKKDDVLRPTAEQLSKLRSITISGGDGDMHTPPLLRMRFLFSLMYLRVLDLEDAKSRDDLRLIGIGGLVLLRYLGLRGTSTYKLPEEIGELEHLETLDLRNTHLGTLPASIVRLRKLVRLLLNHDLQLPSSIWEMEELEELSLEMEELEELSLNVYSRAGLPLSSVAELRDLLVKSKRLRVLSLILDRSYSREPTETYGRIVMSFLKAAAESNLQYLSVSLNNDDLLGLLQYSCEVLPPGLPRFRVRISGQIEGKIPPGMSCLFNLTHLHISVKQAEEEGLRVLGTLPNLVRLELYSEFGALEWCILERGLFPCLEFFWFKCTRDDSGLKFTPGARCCRGVKFFPGAMPKLRWLGLPFTAKEFLHEDSDFGIQHLACLEAFHPTIYCNDARVPEVEAVEAVMREQASLNPNKPTIKLRRRLEGMMFTESIIVDKLTLAVLHVKRRDISYHGKDRRQVIEDIVVRLVKRIMESQEEQTTEDQGKTMKDKGMMSMHELDQFAEMGRKGKLHLLHEGRGSVTLYKLEQFDGRLGSVVEEFIKTVMATEVKSIMKGLVSMFVHELIEEYGI